MDDEELTFLQYLSGSRKVLALCGAGVSIPSGFPSLRTVCEGAMDIVTREAWDTDPGAVWQYYTARRRQAAACKPNKAHTALAKLSNKLGPDRVLTVSHNVDDLQERAGHPTSNLITFLGDVFVVKCTNFKCNYIKKELNDPLVPALDKSEFGSDFYIAMDDLPRCPRCNWMLRPGCVWFGDPASPAHLRQIDEFILSGQVDLLLVVGLSGTVWPTAGYIEEVKLRGGKVAVFNTDEGAKRPEDSWFFMGDVCETLPRELEPWIGRV